MTIKPHISDLRQEYVDIKPQLMKTKNFLDLEVAWHLKALIFNLKVHERIEIESRIKDCDSAIDSLRRRQEGRDFEDNKQYSLKELKDLVGLRILVFPASLIDSVNEVILSKFNEWTSDHIKQENPKILKYDGIVNDNHTFRCEIQIVPMLIGKFWEVEHSAFYKPSPSLKGIMKHSKIQRLYDEVIEKLYEFEIAFEKVISEAN
jgi:ppGpp synthetase/RelA/SpoT-type nucleotidyltranferase